MQPTQFTDEETETQSYSMCIGRNIQNIPPLENLFLHKQMPLLTKTISPFAHYVSP